MGGPTHLVQIGCGSPISVRRKPLTLASPARQSTGDARRLQDGRDGLHSPGDAHRPPARDAALRHQLGVLARSHGRLRPTDRLLWLLLRWLWPRWREALVLVQPATVDRWYREGGRRCWRRRARRPGRPPIDSSRQDLIRRMAGENCFGGAPLIDRRIGFVESRAVSNICSRFSALR